MSTVDRTPRRKEARQLQELNDRAAAALESAPVEARGLALRAKEIAERLEDPEGLARSLYLLGSTRMAEADYAQAEAELRRGLDLAQAVKAPGLMVVILRVLLRCAFLTRNVDAALLRGMQALQLARDLGDQALEALTHNDLGLVYGNLGDFEGALEHLLAGLRLSRSSGSSNLGVLLNNIGNVYLELEDHREARNFFRSAVDETRREGAWKGEAIAQGNLGRAYLLLGEPGEALSWFESSLALYEARREVAYVPPALARVARGLAAVGRTEEAGRAYARAIALLEKSVHGEFSDEVLLAAGRFRLAEGDVEGAIALLQRALALVPVDEVSRRTFDLQEALAEAFERAGDLPEALRRYKEFHRIRLAVADSAITVRIRGLMLQFDVERARQQEEIFRLRNVELAQANEELQGLHAQLEAQNRELHQISIEDSLTGLFNRRYLDLQMEVEISRARRHRRPLCVAMCDIDHFKQINDRYSHAVGDEVLRRIAHLIRNTARLTDVISRYGGEEFLLILPETDLLGAETLTERLRTSVAEHPWHEVAPDLQVTLSIGLAELLDRMDGRGLIDAADARLYEAKRRGRDRVVA